jgi:hypothetical protein
MVWHEAVCPDCNITAGTPFSHEFYIELIVGCCRKKFPAAGFLVGLYDEGIWVSPLLPFVPWCFFMTQAVDLIFSYRETG